MQAGLLMLWLILDIVQGFPVIITARSPQRRVLSTIWRARPERPSAPNQPWSPKVPILTPLIPNIDIEEDVLSPEDGGKIENTEDLPVKQNDNIWDQPFERERYRKMVERDNHIHDPNSEYLRTFTQERDWNKAIAQAPRDNSEGNTNDNGAKNADQQPEGKKDKEPPKDKKELLRWLRDQYRELFTREEGSTLR